MQAINNLGIINYDALPATFTGSATFEHDIDAETLTVTDASSGFPAGDSFRRLHVDVFDKFGNKKYGKIDAAAGNVVLDISTLNVSRGIAVLITVVSTKGLAKDGTAFKIANTQTTGNFDVEK